MEISRRTFFFLGWGILKGRVLYELTPSIIIPKPEMIHGLLYHDNDGTIGAYNSILREMILPTVKKLYERDDLFYKVMKEHERKRS